MDERIKQIADHYGYELQKMQLVEEIGEVLQALSKYEKDVHGTFLDRTVAQHNLAEEIADASIMLQQIAHLTATAEMVDGYIHAKLERQIRRIQNERKMDEPVSVIWAVHGIQNGETHKEYCWRVPDGMTPPKAGQIALVHCCGTQKNVYVTRNEIMKRREAMKHKTVIAVGAVKVQKPEAEPFEPF